MNRAILSRVLWAVVTVQILAARAEALVEAGTVAAVQGAFEVQRAGAWQTVSIGLPVFVADRLRTGSDGRGKVVFRDDSVLDLAPNTEIVLDTQVFDPAGQHFHSLLRLFKGKIRAWVSDYYHEPRARYEIETPTAVAGVRGTEFIAQYNSTAELTEVIGIADQVEVSGKLAVMGAAVQVGPLFYTEVQKGRFPTAPQRLDDARFRQYLEGLELIGTGRRDGLNVLHPAVAGHVLTPQDVPGAPAAAVAGVRPTQPGVGAPEDTLASRLSADVRTNTQPLLDYRQTPPGQVPPPSGAPPPGSVKVDF